MILKNSDSQASAYQLKNSVEQLRGGFGQEDPVGDSYQRFYVDRYEETSYLDQLVVKETNCCESVRNVDPDRLCQQGSALVKTVYSYPNV